MRSVLKHPQVVQMYLNAEVHTGQVLGPIDPRVMKVHISRFGGHPQETSAGEMASNC